LIYIFVYLIKNLFKGLLENKKIFVDLWDTGQFIYFCKRRIKFKNINNKEMNKFKLFWLCSIILLMAGSSPLMSQDDNSGKPAKEKKAKAAKNGNSSATIVAQVSGMNREEKNTMSVCPIHSKHMSLSDNYRANASDYTAGDEYPFAYQLNYRRYCKKCTKIMSKEAEFFDAQDKSVNRGKSTFERCELHNEPLMGNTDQDKIDYEKNPSTDMPHAKQYLFRLYCKTCTKVFKIQDK
jgi:hypothetical protein